MPPARSAEWIIPVLPGQAGGVGLLPVFAPEFSCEFGMARILVIDDERELRGVVVRFLVADGHEVVAAANGREGLQAVRREVPNLVLTDIIMPEQEGVETIIALRREFPDLPIIAMSGGSAGSGSFLKAALRLGARRTLEKPFGRVELLTAVREALDEANPA